MNKTQKHVITKTNRDSKTKQRQSNRHTLGLYIRTDTHAGGSLDKRRR
jgi:hypothetical protein